MKKLVLTATAALALSAASFAMADSAQYPSQEQVKHGGIYVGGGLGYADIDTPKLSGLSVALNGSSAAGSSKTDFNHFAANAHVGYLFPVSQNFLLGAELGYNYLPTTEYKFTAGNLSAKGKYSSYSFDLLAVAKYYLTDQFNVFAKAGATYIHGKAELDQDVVVGGKSYDKGSATGSKVEPKVAVGAGYNITSNLEVTGEYSHTFGHNFTDFVKNADDHKIVTDYPSNNVFLVGLNYYFN